MHIMMTLVSDCRDKSVLWFHIHSAASGRQKVNYAELKTRQILPYFFGCKTVFTFLNNPKNPDPSFKMDLGVFLTVLVDLDFCDCFGSL